jgi:hypothetical protein
MFIVGMSSAYEVLANFVKSDGPRTGLLRHVYASTLLSDGVSVAAVASWLGHGDGGRCCSAPRARQPSDADRCRAVPDAALGGRRDRAEAADP